MLLPFCSIQVFTVQGALIAMSASGHSVAYNTTAVWKTHPTIMWRAQHNVTESGSRLVAGVTVVEGAMPLSNGATMVLLTQDDGKKKKYYKSKQKVATTLSTYRMLLPYHTPVSTSSFSIAWMRGPIAAFVLVVVFMWQLFNRKGKGNNIPRESKRFKTWSTSKHK